MKSTILIKLNSFKSKGFTLVELMVAISIIGILSLIALPNYQGYVNESKAATLLYRIHSIGLAYQDVIATSPDALAKPNQLSSSSFGQAPSYLPGLANQFSEEFGIQFSAQLVNHSGYFNFTGHEAFPVLFLKANSQNGLNVLNALDHVTELKHSFVTPNMMIIALATPYETHQTNLIPSETNTNPPKINQPPKLTDAGTNQQPDASNTGNTQLPDASNTGNTPPPDRNSGDSNTGNQASTSTETSTNGDSESGSRSNAGSNLNWPPGWVKHPDQHIGQQHGHHD